MNMLLGVDIGGTKCAVSLGWAEASDARVVTKRAIPTPKNPQVAIRELLTVAHSLWTEQGKPNLSAGGVSCGSPLDSRAGLILAPPNLPTWERVDIVNPFQEAFGVPVGLQNDANACALAEYYWGAGRGFRNVIFLTFGTGMGAGLILNGQLYTGTNDLAGEVGHLRLSSSGPVGFGKAGSFEGFCSGGGIAQLAQQRTEQWLATGEKVAFCPTRADLSQLTAQRVGEAATQGDSHALSIFRTVGESLGAGLAILVDVLNPERIIIGSIYERQEKILAPIVREVLHREALPSAVAVCQVVSAGLGESVGNFASLSVAWTTWQGFGSNSPS